MLIFEMLGRLALSPFLALQVDLRRLHGRARRRLGGGDSADAA